MRLVSRLPLLLLAVLVFIACAENNPVPTPPPPNTAPPTFARTGTPAPTGALQPNLTSDAPISTTLCPFTGRALNGTNLAERRPLLVKIGNSPPERPQSGLSQADIVFEHLTEGAITRFAAVYYCSDAGEIGPIRSARLIDLELVPMFGAIFAHVGGSEPVRQLIAQSEIAQADFDDYGRAPIFREINGHSRPFNRYSSTGELWALARTKGLITGEGVPALVFDAAVPAGGRPVTTLTIPYRAGLSDTVFTYDPASGAYRRSIGTTPHLDAISGKQLIAADVVVLYAVHQTTNIVEDSLGSRSVKIILTGSGKAVLFRDGQAFDLTWARSDLHALPRFTGADGGTPAFKPGPTWFEIVPPDMQVKTGS